MEGSGGKSHPSSEPRVAVCSPKKDSSSGSRVGRSPRSQSVVSLLLDACPICCFSEGSSSNDDSWFKKVTCLLSWVGLGLGEWAHLPLRTFEWSPWVVVLVHLLWHPRDCLLEWIWLLECWQLVGCVLVADWLNLSVLSSSRWAATSTCQWASLALARAQSQESSSIYHILQGASAGWSGMPGGGQKQGPTFATGTPSRRSRFPGPVLHPILGHMVGGLATSLVGKHHCRSPESPSVWF